MKISLMTDLFQQTPIETALDMAVQAGFKSIELNGIPYWEPHITFFESRLSETAHYRDLLDSRGLSLATVCIQPDITVMEDDEFDQWLNYCLNAIEFGQELGAQALSLIFSGNPFFDRQAQADILYKALSRMNDSAKATDMQIAVEIHPGSFIQSTHEAVQLLKSYDLQTVGYLFCTSHIATYCGENVLEAFEEAKPVINHIHFADTPISLHNHKHLAPGHGELPMAALRDAIIASGYHHNVTFQIYSEAIDKVDTARQSLNFFTEGLKN